MSTSTVRTVCGSSARTDLCGGRSAMTVPTAIDRGQKSEISGQQEPREKTHEENNYWLSVWRIALGAWRFRPGAAANESEPDRYFICWALLHSLRPHGSIPGGSAQAWLRRGKEHCH